MARPLLNRAIMIARTTKDVVCTTLVSISFSAALPTRRRRRDDGNPMVAPTSTGAGGAVVPGGGGVQSSRRAAVSNGGSVPSGAGDSASRQWRWHLRSTWRAGSRRRCGSRPQTIAPENAIDDLEDSDGSITNQGGRVGAWYTYHDATAGGADAGNGHHVRARLRSRGVKCAHTSGSGFKDYGAGFGFDFSNSGSAKASAM
jgi:hypothetical protein